MSRLDTRIIEKIDAHSWRDAEGITERAKLGTNSMLAERDMSIECETGTQEIGVLQGIWIWWCFSHHQPQMKCALQRSEDEIKRMKTDIIERIKEVPSR
jgi:hypothetical protein